MYEILPSKPVYFQGMVIDYLDLEEKLCSRYCRLQLASLFGLSINQGDAWDLPYLNNSKNYVRRSLCPGDIVLCRNLKSSYRGELGGFNQKIDLTHTILYVGVNSLDDNVFIHQYEGRQWLFDETELGRFGLVPEKIILPFE